MPSADPQLADLARIVSQRGLIEFRGTLQALLEQIESNTYEIALFGRVSSGKSSLLNAMLGRAILPVGVTPVTALATRIAWGETEEVRIVFTDSREQSVAPDRLAEFVSESGNPDNAKAVARATVTLPSRSLQAGIALIDTPGVGSLARSGAREAYRYLPRCDLGVLLIDAAGAPAPEDLGVLKLFHDSGIEALLAVSKADLLDESEQRRTRDYLRATVKKELEADIPIHFVSSLDSHIQLAQRFFAGEIEPRSARAKALAQASAQNKLRALRDGVISALRSLLWLRESQQSNELGRELADPNQAALQAEGILRDLRQQCLDLAGLTRYAPALAMRLAAQPLADPDPVRQTSTAEILRRAALKAAEEFRAPMRDELLGAQDQLRKVLAQMATPFPFLAIRTEDVAVDFLTQPGIDWSAPGVKVVRPWWARFRPVAVQRHLTVQLENQVGVVLEEAFAVLGRELRQWAEQIVTQLGERFSAQSEPIHAYQLRIAESKKNLPDSTALMADLRALGADTK